MIIVFCPLMFYYRYQSIHFIVLIAMKQPAAMSFSDLYFAPAAAASALFCTAASIDFSGTTLSVIPLHQLLHPAPAIRPEPYWESGAGQEASAPGPGVARRPLHTAEGIRPRHQPRPCCSIPATTTALHRRARTFSATTVIGPMPGMACSRRAVAAVAAGAAILGFLAPMRAVCPAICARRSRHVSRISSAGRNLAQRGSLRSA